MERDEKIKEFVLKGGVLFNITNIDVVRDGGTRIVYCSNGKQVYVDKEEKTFHESYPIREENQIQDDLLIAYLCDRIETYITRQEENVKHLKSFFNL